MTQNTKIKAPEGLELLTYAVNEIATVHNLQATFSLQNINYLRTLKIEVERSKGKPNFKRFEERVMGNTLATITHEDPYNKDNHTLLVLLGGEDPLKKTRGKIAGFAPPQPLISI